MNKAPKILGVVSCSKQLKEFTAQRMETILSTPVAIPNVWWNYPAKRRRHGRLSNRFQERSSILLIAHRPKCKLVADNKPVHRCNAISDTLENGVRRSPLLCGELNERCFNALFLAQQ